MRILRKLTSSFDWIAGWVVLATMVLVTGNVILRPFNYPITGTYEWTGFLTALSISLALAHTAIQGGHTIITMVVDRFPCRVQQVVRMVVRIMTGLFLTLCAWQVAVYADNTWKSGEVAPTTKVPFWPIMFIVAASILLYAVVEFAKVIGFISGWLEPRAAMNYAPGPGTESEPDDGWEDDAQ